MFNLARYSDEVHNVSQSGSSDEHGRFSDLSRPGLDVRAVRRALCPPSGPFARVEIVDESASTNEQLAAAAAADEASWPDLSVLSADFQSAGAGRRGRGWSAPPRSAVLVSVLLRPGDWPSAAYGWVPLLGGLAAAEALDDVAGLATGVKWPNDVLLRHGEKKLVGVLARALTIDSATGSENAVVLGAGINVSLTAGELPVDTATSIGLAGGATTDRDTVLRAHLRRVAYWYAAMRESGGDAEAAGLAAAVRDKTLTIGKDVTAELPGGDRLTGRARAMDDSGRLVIVGADGAATSVSAGDVVHLRAGDK